MQYSSSANWRTVAKGFTATSFSAAISFIAQRILTWKSLGLYTLPTAAMRIEAQITGLLADVWGGVVTAFLITFVIAIFPPLRRHSKISFFIFNVFAITFLNLHIPYVEFFGAMISLSHFKYLLDWQFLTSSSSNLTDVRIFAISGISLVVFIMVSFFLRNIRRPIFLAFCTALLGGFCQFSKVQLNTKKIGWKTPAVLAVTSIEYAFIQMMDPADVRPPSLTYDELQNLRHFRDAPKDATTKDILETGYRRAESDLGVDIKRVVRSRISENKPIMLFVALLESLRPEESKFFTPANPRTYTPFIDSLAQTSVAFTNAWTSGGVTRAGQEAVFCGLWSGEFTAAMRNLISLNPLCLPQLLTNEFAPNAWSAWWHAGDYDFDSQGTFWKRHGINYATHRKSFEEGTPATFWGNSDFALVEKFRNDILEQMPRDTLVSSHLFLTVTNHPDWGLPSDATPELLKMRDLAKPNFLTTQYTDAAVSRLVDVLHNTPCLKCQSESLWDTSIFILVNDHGHLVPSQLRPEGRAFGISNLLDIDAADASSRAALIVSGGIVQKALKQKDLLGIKIQRPASQVDIFATLADLVTDADIATIGDSLFSNDRRWPVMVDLGKNVYFPELKKTQTKVFSRQNLLIPTKEKISHELSKTDFELNKTVFRAYQNLLTAGDAGRIK